MSTIVCARARVSHCVSVCVSASLAAFQPARFNFSFGFFSHCNFFAHIYKFLCRQIIFSIEIDKHTTAAKKNERDSQISYRYVNTMWWNFYAMWRNSIRYSTNLSVRVEMKKTERKKKKRLTAVHIQNKLRVNRTTKRTCVVVVVVESVWIS